MAEKKTSEEKIEREYIIPLRFKWEKTQKYNRTKKTIKAIREFLVRHMKVYDRDLNKIKIDKFLNEIIWLRGAKKPPAKIRVKVRKEKDFVYVEAIDLPNKIKFKKERIERIEKEHEEKKKKKKEVEKVDSEPEKEKSEEEEKKEEEKKSALVETGQELAKKAAKTTKHQTKFSKQPKRQVRQALQK